VGLVVLVLAYTATYNLAMARLEGVDQSLFASFEFVVQTMTTTGYGQDSGYWSHPLMFLFVAGTQISGIALGFFTLRLVIIPLFTGAEVNLDDRLTPKSDHVVICEYRRDSAVLLDERRELDIEYVLIASDRDEAKLLSDSGYSVIHGSPQDATAFERASIGTARAVITDAGEANVNTLLTVQSVREDLKVIALSDDSDDRDILLEAGADSVLSPHGLLGRRLAEKAVSSVGSKLDTIDLGGNLEVTELPVSHGSPLVGTEMGSLDVTVIASTMLGVVAQYAGFVSPQLRVTTVQQIASRISPGFLSMAVGICAGGAGAFGLATALPVSIVGVMIAAALIPAAAAIGVGLAFELPAVALGAGILLLVNLASVNLTGFLVLWGLGFRPRSWTDGWPTLATIRNHLSTITVVTLLLVAFAGASVVTAQQVQVETAVNDAVSAELERQPYEQLQLLSVQTRFGGVSVYQIDREVTVTVSRPDRRSYPTLAGALQRRITRAIDEETTVEVTFNDRLTARASTVAPRNGA